MPRLTLDVDVSSWPLAQAFVISRGAKTQADVVVARLTDGTHTGQGECVPYARYGETVDSVVATLKGCTGLTSRENIQRLAPGAARNALDCALWDLDAKRQKVPVHTLLGLPSPKPVPTCYTLSLASPEDMAAAARSVPQLTLLKLKLGGDGDTERMEAVRRARPDARLVADANEAWTPELLPTFLDVAAQHGFELIEQPLPADQDDALASVSHPVPICADESAHTSCDLEGLRGRYGAVNIKLDKAGGLTEALAMASKARALGLKIMAGSMVATSLAVAPALLIAQVADWTDLDGPLLLAEDRPHGLKISNGVIAPACSELWG